MDLSGSVNDGRVYGVIGLRSQGTGGGMTINVNGDGININGIPAIERFGVRGNGNIKGNSLNMKIELMMDSSFGLEPVLAEVLGPYRLSPGYYVIPFSHSFPLSSNCPSIY